MIRSSIHTLALLALAALAAPAPAPAQQPDMQPTPDSALVELRVGDGTRYVGRVVETREDQLVFETISGVRMEVSRAFARLDPVRGRVVNGEFWRADKNSTRLFFAPTGRTLEAGAAYAGLFFVLPFVGAGVTDDLTIAGGMPPAGSLDDVPIWVAPKLRVHHTPNSQISVGVFALHAPGYEEYNPTTGAYAPTDGTTLGIAYGMGTWGDADRAVHAGVGITFGNVDDVGRVPVMLGGEMRVSRKHKLITENWVLPGKGGAISGGMRWIGRRWTTDLGWMAIVSGSGEEGGVPYFPIASFSYAFGADR